MAMRCEQQWLALREELTAGPDTWGEAAEQRARVVDQGIDPLQFSWDFPALLRCLVAKGGGRDLKADAAGCQKSDQAVYTHFVHPGVRIAEPEGGF